METLKIIMLGAFQGVAEFLPISSSGHLAILQKLFGLNDASENLTLNILLHVATLLAIFMVYYKELWALIKEGFSFLGDLIKLKPNFFKNDDRKLLMMIIISCIPTGILGLIIEALDEKVGITSNTKIVGTLLLVTAIILFVSKRFENGKKQIKDATIKDSFIVGLLQGIAVLPGISRSGTTITTGMVCGFSKELAVRFSFFMSMPIILLAAIKDMIFDGGLQGFEISYLYSMITATIVGYFSIKLLIKMIENKKYSLFAWYCLCVGLITIFLI